MDAVDFFSAITAASNKKYHRSLLQAYQNKNKFKNSNMLKTILETAQKHIYLTTGLLSLLISLWLFASKDIISRDATLYMYTAQAFLDNGIGAAFKVWAWPFYPITIAITHKITGFSLENSAYFLSILMEMIISVTFVKIYQKIAFNGAHLWVAMLFILTFATLSDYKADIWREYGFWSFGLLAVYQFILYYQTRSKTNALLWQLCIFIATLYRVEAIVFAVLAPFYFLFLPHNKVKNILTLNSVFYSLGLISILVILVSSQLQELILNNLPAQATYLSPKDILGNFNLAADNFAQYVLPFDYSARYSHFIIASGILSMLILKLITNLSPVYFGIWLTGAYKHWIKNTKEAKIIYYFSSLSLLILLVFITSRLFVSSRYTVFLLLLIGLIFSQYLDYFIYYLSRNKHKKWLIALSLFISIQFLDGMITTTAKKTPMQQAGLWLSQHIKPGEAVFCNESRLSYYSKQPCYSKKTRFYKSYQPSDIQYLQKNNISYLLLWVKHKNKTMIEKLKNDNNLQLIKEFNNKRYDKSLILKVK